MCFSDVWRGREHPVHVATEGLSCTLWYCQLKLDSPWNQLSVKSQPIHEQALDSLTLTPLLQPQSSPAAPTARHTREGNQQLSDSYHITASHRLIQRHLMMAAKVGFPYPHGLLSLCCWYSVWVCVCIPPLLWKKLEKHTKKKLSFSQSGSLIWY